MQGAAPAPHLRASIVLEEDVVRVLRDDGSLDADSDPRADPIDIVAIYSAMIRVRALDQRLVALQRAGRIAFHVGSLGEEAAILGSAAALREKDWIFPCQREFGAALWRGMPLRTYVHHMFGSEADPMKGRPMPDQYGAKVARFTSISAPTGTQITQAVGFAWAAKIKKDDVATLVYFGHGATRSGEFHNGINFAGVFGAPVVLFCRNDGSSSPAERQTGHTGHGSLASKGVAYGVPGVRCDGNDLFAVLKVCRDAIARASRGEGPTLIEALTARTPASNEGGAAFGRSASPGSLSAWKRTDPLARVRRHLESRGLWSDAMQHDREAEALAEIDEAVAVAERRAPPALSTMFDDVFGALTPQLEEQRAELRAAPRAQGLAKP